MSASLDLEAAVENLSSVTQKTMMMTLLYFYDFCAAKTRAHLFYCWIKECARLIEI